MRRRRPARALGEGSGKSCRLLRVGSWVDRGYHVTDGYVTRRMSWSAVSASTPNMPWHITFAGPRTRTWRPPNSSLRRPLTRSSGRALERRHVGLSRAGDQVALPMSRNRAVLNRRGALANRDGPDDVAARLRRRGPRTSNRASLAQLRLQRLFEHAAALHEQAEIDRFVRHAHGRIIRIRPTEPTGDLLGRPLLRELGGYRVTQRGVRRQATPLGPPAARPRRRVGRGRRWCMNPSRPERFEDRDPLDLLEGMEPTTTLRG